MADWTVLGEDTNPIPGDPYEVAALGKQMRNTAAMIMRQANSIGNLTDGNGWDSDAGDEFKKKAGDTADKLMGAYHRYHGAADALGDSVDTGNPDKNWASALHHCQTEANKLLTKAEQAHSDSQAANTALGKLPKSDSSDSTKTQHSQLTSKKNTADGDLTTYKRQLQGIKDYRDAQAHKAAGQIGDAIQNEHDSTWDKVKAGLAVISHIAGVVAAIAGVLSLVLGWVPILGQALIIIAAAASVVAFLCDLTLACAGDGNWLDVAIDLVGVLSLGAGRLLGDGVKAASYAAKAEAVERDATLLTKAGMDAKDSWGLAVDFSEDFKNPAEVMDKLAHGPSSWMPGGKSLLGLCRPMKGMVKAFGTGAKDAKGVLNAGSWAARGQKLWSMRAIGDPEMMETLKGVDTASGFGHTASLGTKAWFVSQGGAIGLGWSNLEPNGLPLENHWNEPGVFNNPHLHTSKEWADSGSG